MYKLFTFLEVNGLEAIVRGCIRSLLDGCTEVESDFVSGEACFCSTDLCNSASKMSAIFGLLIVPILFIVTFL